MKTSIIKIFIGIILLNNLAISAEIDNINIYNQKFETNDNINIYNQKFETNDNINIKETKKRIYIIKG